MGGAEGLGDRGDRMLSLRLRFMDCRGEGRSLAGRSSAVVSPASSTPTGVATSCFTCRFAISLSMDNSSACDKTDWLLYDPAMTDEAVLPARVRCEPRFGPGFPLAEGSGF